MAYLQDLLSYKNLLFFPLFSNLQVGYAHTTNYISYSGNKTYLMDVVGMALGRARLWYFRCKNRVDFSQASITEIIRCQCLIQNQNIIMGLICLEQINEKIKTNMDDILMMELRTRLFIARINKAYIKACSLKNCLMREIIPGDSKKIWKQNSNWTEQ